jgi:thiol-disulfide isomerase/thioredoxin
MSKKSLLLKISLFGLLCFSFFEACNIQFETSKRVESDQYEKIDSSLYVSAENQTITDKADSIIFIEVDSNYLFSKVINETENSWLYFISYWCPHCMSHLNEFRDISSKYGISFIPISMTYDVEKITTSLEKYNYSGVIYILDHKYGSTEEKKFFKFRSIYSKDSSNQQYILPINDFFPINGKVKTVVGSNIDEKNIKNSFNL